MNQSFRESKIGEFTIQTYGDGDPIVMCIGGLASAPSDYADIASRIDGTTHVLNNPIHTGAVQRMEKWRDWLHEQYCQIFKHLGVQYPVGHSGGGLDVIEASQQLSEETDVEGIVTLAPSLHKPSLEKFSGERRAYEHGLTHINPLLDANLSSVCTDLPLEMYLQLAEAHNAEYGAGRRAKDIYSIELKAIVDAASRIIPIMQSSRIPILVIIGEQDPWHNDEDTRLSGHDHITVQRIKGAGHYVQAPLYAQETSGIMNKKFREWKKSHAQSKEKIEVPETPSVLQESGMLAAS